MDITTIIGLVLSIGGIFSGFLIEGGNLGALLAISPILIIFGGTFGAVTITQPKSNIKQIPKILKVLFTEVEYDYLGLIDQSTKWARASRKDGIMVLQDVITKEITEPFLKRSLQMVVDNVDAIELKSFLDNEISGMEDRHAHNAAIFETAGGFAPTMGIIGTVLGLITILAKLGGSASALGEGIASAFLATFMGISTANLIYLPFAGKLRSKSEKEVLYRKMVMASVTSIQAQVSPHNLKSNLETMLAAYMLTEKVKINGKETTP